MEMHEYASREGLQETKRTTVRPREGTDRRALGIKHESLILAQNERWRRA